MNRNLKCLKHILIPSFFAIILIILYSIILFSLGGNKKTDILIKIRSPYFGNFLNGWTLTHFIFFFYLGYNYPTCMKEAMLVGILWELIEFSVGKYLPYFSPKLAFKIDPQWTSWYYGCWEDIIMNFIGFSIGKKLRLYK